MRVHTWKHVCMVIFYVQEQRGCAQTPKYVQNQDVESAQKGWVCVTQGTRTPRSYVPMAGGVL